MKNLYKTSSILALFLLISNISFGHFGARGLLGGSIKVGIEYNGIVYLGTEDAGVFESTNNQLVAWRARPVGLKSGKITALTHSGKELYAATADSGVFIFNGFDGNDRFWNKINNGLASLNISSLLALDSTTILAGTKGSGLFLTTDKGQNWAVVNSNLLNDKKISALTKGGDRLFALVEDGGVFASDDNGANWFDLNDQNTLNILKSKYFTYNAITNELLVSNASGLWVLQSASTTTNPTYTAALTGLPINIHIHNLANNGVNWYVSSHSGVFSTNANVVNWTEQNTGLTTINVGTVVVSGNVIIAGTGKKGVFKSNVDPINWVLTNTGLANINVNSVTCKGDDIVVAATEYGVTVSTNTGNTPVIRNNGLTDSLNVNDVEFAGNKLFATTKLNGVFVSDDLGLNWVAQNTGLSNLNIKRLIYGNDRVYVIDSNGKLFQSNLDNLSWSVSESGLPSNANVTSVAFYNNNLILGTLGNGVYIKHRDSLGWREFNSGLTNLDVTSVTYLDGKFYVGTVGSGVFISEVGSANWNAVSTISISHFNNVQLNPNHILYLTTIKNMVVATFKGGAVGTLDGGNTWVPAGNQFNLPSFSNINKASSVSSRIFVSTEKNSVYSNALSEINFGDTVLTVNEVLIEASSEGSISFQSVTSNVNWTVSSSESWVTLNSNQGVWNDNLKLTIAENTTAQFREAIVTLVSGTKTKTFTVRQDGVTNVNSLVLNNVTLYPNPNNGKFIIDVNSELSILNVNIFDNSGRLITSILENNNNQIEVSKNLSSGVYFVQITSDKGTAVKKMIVE
jgi:hypothetical protein